MFAHTRVDPPSGVARAALRPPRPTPASRGDLPGSQQIEHERRGVSRRVTASGSIQLRTVCGLSANKRSARQTKSAAVTAAEVALIPVSSSKRILSSSVQQTLSESTETDLNVE